MNQDTAPILRVEHIIKAYGEQTILKDVSLSLQKGEIKVLIGPSGEGKALFFRALIFWSCRMPEMSGSKAGESIPPTGEVSMPIARRWE
jgi:polar amino acid transport system ATP-binding protein